MLDSARHRSQRPSSLSLIAALLVAVSAFALIRLYPLALAYRSVGRVDLDTTEFGSALSTDSPAPSPDAASQPAVSPADIEQPMTFLLIGTDSRAGLEDLSNFGDFEGRRADVIMLAVVRPDQAPVLVSIPRDLWAPDPCGSGNAKINAAMEGCGDEANGPSALAAVVESITGLSVDHFVAVDLAGFSDVIDLVGGYMICVEHPVRDVKSGLSLPEGCTLASGDQTLAWVRSRHTEEQVDGRWRTMSGVSDLTRNSRQRQLMIDMFGRLKGLGPEQLLELATSAADDVTLDRGLDLQRSVSVFQAIRSVDSSSIQSLAIPVADSTRGDAYVLVPTVDIADWLSAQLEEGAVAAFPSPGRDFG